MKNNCLTCMALLTLCLGVSCHPQQARVSGPLFHGPIGAAGETAPATVLIIPTNGTDKAVEQVHPNCRANLSRADDARRGAVPDMEINAERLTPFLNADDPELAFVLDVIAKGSQLDNTGEARQDAGCQ